MATKTRTKAPARNGKTRGGKRPPVKVKTGPDIPLLPVAVGAILLVLVIALIGYIVYSSRPAPRPSAVAGIPCDQGEHTQVHYHTALQIIYNGTVTDLPDNAGIMTDSGGNTTCYYWLHVHAGTKNVIHIESPAADTFTLGQFIDVWAKWAQASGNPVPKLDSTHVATFTLTPDQQLKVYVDLQDGKGPQLYTGDPRSIALKSHEVITLEVTPPDTTPPSFTFTGGL